MIGQESVRLMGSVVDVMKTSKSFNLKYMRTYVLWLCRNKGFNMGVNGSVSPLIGLSYPTTTTTTTHLLSLHLLSHLDHDETICSDVT